MRAIQILWHYWRSKQLRFSSRQQLIDYQHKQLNQFKRRVLTKSPYFSQFIEQDFPTWPLMNKAIMLENFASMNTAGLTLAQVLKCAQQAEHSRDFSPSIGKYSVGLSSGTSDLRGVFVVSANEQAKWAGVMLAKLLPDGLLKREKIALLLRANNNLYSSVKSRHIDFKFFDLLTDFSTNCQALQHYQPTIIVAPAQVLRALALEITAQQLQLSAKLVVSVAEVLDERDKQLLHQTFPKVAEVYQATEGFLASTCDYNNLHLNEEHLIIEPQWLDASHFMPIITDFSRTTQPIIRYQLDDILQLGSQNCPCSNQGLVIAKIIGRHNDMLTLPSITGASVKIFADICCRVMTNSLPIKSDFQLTLMPNNQLILHVEDAASLALCQQNLKQFFQQQQVDINKLSWQLATGKINADWLSKKRKIKSLV